jgi:anaerobic selenocysteine-containing dehydrogenase
MEFRLSRMGERIVGADEVIPSNCGGFHGGCGALVDLRNGAIFKIECDPDLSTNRGTMCSNGLAFNQLVYYPDCLRHPLRRDGQKGEGEWERISRHEALGTCPDKLGKSLVWLWYEHIV